MSRRRSLWVVLLLVTGLFLLLQGCGEGPLAFLGRSSDMDRPDSASAGATRWVVTTEGEGPRWLGPTWWRSIGVSSLDQTSVRLERDGEGVPTLQLESPDGAGLLFYSQPVTGDLQTYRLSIGQPGLEMEGVEPTADASGGQSQVETESVLRMELNNTFRSTAPLDNPWLWTSLRPPQELSVTVPLTDGVGTSVTMTLQVWGQSRMPVDPDHHLRISWNGSAVDDHFWDGSELETWSVALPVSEGDENTLLLSAPGGTDADVDLIWLDALEFRWRRRLVLGEGDPWISWEVGTQSHAAVKVMGDDPLVALRVGADGRVRQSAVQEMNGTTQIYQEGAHRAWLGVPWQAPDPLDVRPWSGLDDPDSLREAEFIIVADDRAAPAVQPLLDAREGEGISSQHLTPEAVYDTFGRGLPEAAPIRGMIRELSALGRLRYVLLVGDTVLTPDPADQVGSDSLSIPTAWVETAFVGSTASDSALASDADGNPRVALGRLPASTVDEVRAMVAKTLAWEPNRRMALVNDDALEFAKLTDRLSEIRSPDLRLSSAEDGARQRILEWLDAGPGTLTYSGHGSLPVLGDEKLLTWEDAGAWDGPTVVVAWTCLCASFAHPNHQSLAEAWMLDRQGTVAFVGPTGETTTAEQTAMALALQRALVSGERLGDAMVQGWQSAQSDDARVGFLLLGDPTLRPVSVE